MESCVTLIENAFNNSECAIKMFFFSLKACMKMFLTDNVCSL